MRAAAEHVNRNIGGYVAGNLVISLLCGVVTTISLYLLHVPYSLALGVFMAVFDIIPLIGATLGSIVVVASGLIFVDVRTAVILFVIVMVYQQIENHVLQPMIYGRTVQLPSLTILVAVLCGGALLGLVGALLAIPVAATVQAVVGELLEERADRIANASTAEAEMLTNQGRMMKLATVEDVYAAQLGDLRSAERQLLEALPAMADAASDRKLNQAFAEHLEQTERHLERLDEVITSSPSPVPNDRCEAMQGLISEVTKIIRADGPGEVKDVALIAAAQRVEHYEISAYGTARALADQLDQGDARALLGETLERRARLTSS